MKKLAVVLAGLLALPAFAEVAPAYYYDEIAEYETPADVEIVDEVVADDTAVESDTTPNVASQRTTSTSRRATTTRGTTRPTAVGTTARVTTRRNATNATTTRGTVARATTTRNAASTRTSTPTVANRATATRGTAARAGTDTATRRASTRAPITARAGSLVQTDTVNTPLYTGRVGVRRTAMAAGTRATGIRASAIAVSDLPTVAVTTSVNETPISVDVDTLAETTDFCRAQYTACMDNYCNVLDDNQGRCSCSANLKNYEKTEAALKQATEQLQDVSQKIQYIGLGADDIETLFTQTEAEAQLQSKTDNTQLKNDLDKIKKLIIDVKTGTATSTETDSLTDWASLFDGANIGTGFEFTSLFGNNTANTSSISNQRGEQLYKTAAARCKASVLKSCEAQGVDISLITNSYDLEIDKQCLVYERSLTDANDEMTSTVRNAKNVLQRARLMVAQQKNSLDLRGCITELDACMQNEFVCGDNYENCLDPSGRYILNGEIVIGGRPGVSGGDLNTLAQNSAADGTKHPLYSTWNYAETKNNAWGPYGTIAEYVDEFMAENTEVLTKPTTNMATFLQSKIGYHDDKTDRNQGMCMSVLNKCQNYTYNDSGKYQTNNVVIREYLNRTLASIKNSQDQVLADHAEECISDVSSCLTQNKYETAPTTAISACKPQIVTCMSVNAIVDIDAKMKEWVTGVMSNKDVVNSVSLPDTIYCGQVGSSATESGAYTVLENFLSDHPEYTDSTIAVLNVNEYNAYTKGSEPYYQTLQTAEAFLAAAYKVCIVERSVASLDGVCNALGSSNCVRYKFVKK